MDARGGARPGAGRPKGSMTKRTQELVAKATAEGLTPLEVMLQAMRVHVEADRWDDAASIAKDAAPYIHPRLAAVEHTGSDGGPVQIERIERVIVDPADTDAEGLSPAA